MDCSHWVRCLIVSAFLLTPPVFAEDEPGPARLLADLAPGDFLSFDFRQYIRGFSRVGSQSVFLRNENEDLQALWVTDGTEQGTRSLGVIGTWLETVVQLGSTGGLAFYGVGYEETVIWRTDGTPAGTFPVTSGLRPPGGFGATLGSVSAGLLYFRACSPGLGCELWVSDGSAAGTAPVGEIVPGPESGGIPGIREIAAVGGQAFLIADEPGGTSLWIADRQGLTRLRETPGASHLTVQLAQGKGRAFFFAQDADGGLEVWASDGTAAGTRPVTSFSPAAPFPQEGFLALFSGRAWFAADNGIHGTELWSVGDRPGSQRRSTNFPDPSMSITDVAKAGQRIVFAAAGPGAARRIWSSRGDIRSTAPLTGCPGGCPAPIGPLAVLSPGAPDRLVLYGSNQKGAGFWVTDGTRAGTRLLRRSELHGSAQAVAVGGRVLFALGEESLADIWITDGSANGTFFVTHGNRYGFAAGAAGGSIVFSGVGYQEEDWPVSEVLWRSDGTPAGSRPLTQAKIPRSSSPQLITPFRDGVLAQTCPRDYDKLRELWFATQAGDGTRLFRTVIEYCYVFAPVVLEKAAVLYSAGYGQELWLTDGTPQGTAILVPDSSSPSAPFQFGDEAAFWFHDSELWLTDGTIGGTRKHLDFPARATYLAGRFWFFSDSRLWVSDGTPAGTLPLTPANQTEVYPFLIEAGSLVYFQFDGGIWRSDGTPAGTGPAITAASGALLPESLSVAQGRLYFAAPRIGDPRGPALPWVSDGTDAGTVLLADVPAFSSFTELDGRVFFAAADPLHGDELWSTDGTSEGTSRLLDIAPGLLGSQPRELTVWNGRLWFRARDAVHGMELWSSDGTAEGTRLVQDIAPGASWSTPAHLAPSAGGLYFSADDGVHGEEVWLLP
jgi:ELWxxDGT repeat protein